MSIRINRWQGITLLGLLALFSVAYLLNHRVKSLEKLGEHPIATRVSIPLTPNPIPLALNPIPRQAPEFGREANAPTGTISTDLLDWAKRYLSATPAERPELLSAGIALAKKRRALMADLIISDPQAALASALPRLLRSQLPMEIIAELEEIVSARAPLEIIQTCLHPVGAIHDHADDLYRATVIDHRELRVYPYGHRLHDATLPATSLYGIAIDGQLAVSDSRVRILEPGEPLPPGTPPITSGGLAVEANGRVTVLPSPDALPAFEAAILATEENPVILAADSGSGVSGVVGRPSQAWTYGNKKLIVIRVDFSDLPGTPINKFDSNALITEDYVNNVINGPSGVRSFLQQNSFNKTDLLLTPTVAGDSPDITQVLRLPSTAGTYASAGSNTLLHSDARAAATSAGYNLAAYDRIAVVFSYLGGLTNSKITYGGLANIIGSSVWVNGSFDLRVVAHELGHTYGLYHANLWQVGDGNPVSLAGSSTEYGDPFDIMGAQGTSVNHFSHWNKALLQWIPDSAVTLAAATGTFRVHRFDSSTADLGLPRALKIVRDSTRDYWIGYRRATASTNADNGATVIWGYNSSQQGNLLDLTTPGTSPSDAPLALNVNFNDSAAGIAIMPIAQGGTGADEWLDIQVTLQPRIAWTSTNYIVNEQGGSAVLTVNRTSNFNGSVSVNYATAPGSASTPADYATTNGTLTWAAGDMAPKTISIPIVADAIVEGTEVFTVTLSSPVGGVVVDPATTTVTIADPGARDTSFAADFINNTVYRSLVLPDGKILIAGLFNQLQDSASALYDYGGIARLNSTGVIDTTFNPGTGANNTVYALARQPDGKILIGGSFTSFNGIARAGITRLDATGLLDTTFNPGSGVNGTVYAILPQTDGKILIGGNFTAYNGTAREYLARLNTNGSLDNVFVGPDFAQTSGLEVDSLALQKDGNILVGGAFYFNSSSIKAGLCRLTPNGTIDSLFTGVTTGAEAGSSTLPRVNEIIVQPDNKILIAGEFTTFNSIAHSRIARLSSTGVLDAAFSPQPNSDCTALLLLPDLSILIGGNFTAVGGATATRIAHLTSSGVLDSGFAAVGGFNRSNPLNDVSVQDLTLQPDGNVILAGDYGKFQTATTSSPIWRLVPGLSGTPGVLQFAVDAINGIEGTSLSLNVTRSGGSLGALTIGYSTVPGSATAGSDYTTTAGILNWTNGDTAAKSISIPILADLIADTPEKFLVNIGSPLIGGVILSDRQQTTVTVETAFGNWASSRFTASELADPTISGDLADPDGDGLNNLTEFALGREPRISDANGAWTTAIQNISSSNYLTLTFRRRVPVLDLAYTVQAGNDLTSGGWAASAVQVGAAVSNGDGTETVTYRDTFVTSSQARRFMRVMVTRTP